MDCKESICRNCFHSYVCEQFNENKDDNNEKCHFFNDHYIPTADVVPKSEYEAVVSAVDNSTKEFLKLHDDYQKQKAEIERLEREVKLLTENTITAKYPNIVSCSRGLILTKSLEEYDKLLGDIASEVAREIFEEIEKLSYYAPTPYDDEINVVDYEDIAELKKNTRRRRHEEEKQRADAESNWNHRGRFVLP